MKLTYVVSYLLTIFGLVISIDHSDKQLFCKTYSLVSIIKDVINSTKMKNRMLISDLDSRIKNSLSNLKERLDGSELQNLQLKNYTTALQDEYTQVYSMLGNENIEDAITVGPFGGHGGRAFTDAEVALHGNITAVHYSINNDYGERLGRLGMSYGDLRVLHGNTWSTVTTENLHYGEFIVGVKGCTLTDKDAHHVIYELTFQTNERNITLIADNCTRGSPFGNIPVSSPYRKLAYISGRTGSLIDQLSFHYFNSFENQ